MEKTVKSLKNNGFTVELFENGEEVKSKLLKEIKTSESVGIGGSMTILEVDIYKELIARGNKTYWHWKVDDAKTALKNAANSNVYLTSSNAVTEDGKLVNKDGTGNRVASMIYGHERVYIIVGKNKICKDVDEAFKRIETIAAPLNAKRLNLKTPCVYTGVCSDCDSAERICKAETIISKNPNGTEIHVFLINEEMGY